VFSVFAFGLSLTSNFAPQVLDFDFEKFCSVSLSNLNVYACLVCGKYYQGRGRKSHAYTHSLEAGHHVFINLHSEKVYCLPDGYEVNDPSLDDIRYVLNPRYAVTDILDEVVRVMFLKFWLPRGMYLMWYVQVCIFSKRYSFWC
jgi:hypothetical protein